MDFDYVVAPILIVLIVLVVAMLCLYRMRRLRTAPISRWRRVTEYVSLSLIVVFSFCLGGSSAFNAVALHRYRWLHGSPGTRYIVEGYEMNLYCTGGGSPTLILDAGLGGDSLIWGQVQPELSKTTRVCSYDRAGFGRSDPRPGPQDADNIAEQLHALLIQAEVEPPFVLMGHSIAGIYIRDYATRYPQDVAGLVFVDSATPLQEEDPAFKAISGKQPNVRLLTSVLRAELIVGIPRILGQCSQVSGFDAHVGKMLAEDMCGLHTNSVMAEMNSIKRSGEETIHSGPFGELPILILSSDPHKDPPPQLRLETGRKIAVIWNQMQENLKNPSTRSRRIIAKGSGHNVQIERPDLINSEIPLFIEQIRARSEHSTEYGATTTK